MKQSYEIRELLLCYMEAILIDKDIEKMLTFVTEDVVGMGIERTQMATCREDMRRVAMKNIIFKSNTDYKIKFDFMEERFHGDDFVSLWGVLCVHKQLNDCSVVSSFKQSVTMRRQQGQWRICGIHISPNDLPEPYALNFTDSSIKGALEDWELKAFDFITNSIPGGMIGVYLEQDYPIYFINSSMLRHLEYTRDEFMQETGGKMLSCIHPDDRETVVRQITNALAEGYEYEMRYRLLKRNGQPVWVSERGRRCRLLNGQEVAFGVYMDITEVLLLQGALEEKAEALERKNAELLNLTNNVAGGVCTLSLDEKLTIQYANAFFYRMFGYTKEKMADKNSNWLINLILPEDVKTVRQAIQSAFDARRPNFGVEVRGMKSYGQQIWLMLRGSFLYDNAQANIHCVILDITERKQIEHALRRSEERFRIALKKTSYVIFDYDIRQGKITHSNLHKTSSGSGMVEDMQETLLLDGKLLPEYYETFADAFLRIRQGETQVECVVQILRKDNTVGWNKLTMTSITDISGQAVRAIGMVEDLTHQKEIELAYRREEQYRQAFLANAMASYVINFSKNEFESSQVSSSLCFEPEDFAPYDAFMKEKVLATLYGEDRDEFYNTFCLQNILSTYEKGETDISLEYRIVQHDSSLIWLMTKLRILVDSESSDLKGFMYVVDVDAKKREELLLTYKSERDSLTSLYHKGVAETRIKEVLASENVIEPSVFFLLDIDRFKNVNDVYGHPFGDKILKAAADGICGLLKQGSIVGRLGGDEFGIFFRRRGITYDIAKELAHSLCAMFSSLTPKEGNVPISCSIGIAISWGTDKTFETLYQEADEALYRVKKGGRNGYAFYDETPHNRGIVPPACFYNAGEGPD